ncbi:MAG: hypothetical protein IK049_01760 [Oscillospiraceae bacterium]|nr:hypothetical protein [Oscillospiraceae bacterium]
MVNRSETEPAELKIDFFGVGDYSSAEVMTIRGMETVTEKAEIEGSTCNTVLAPLSWNLIRLS